VSAIVRKVRRRQVTEALLDPNPPAPPSAPPRPAEQPERAKAQEAMIDER
jgi:hypothetical protein